MLPSRDEGRWSQAISPEGRAAFQFAAKKYQFFHDEGAAVLIDPSRTGWRNNFCSIGHGAAAVI